MGRMIAGRGDKRESNDENALSQDPSEAGCAA
jgi:hypothetical protein